jgi:hypothetical protein
MSKETTEEDVRSVFHDMGVIYRIDFTQSGKEPGFTEKLSGRYKSAFVHISDASERAKHINIWVRGGETHKVIPNKNSREFWFIRPARVPKQNTMMNTTQIVENCRFLEKKVKEQDATIAELKKTVDGLHSTVYQLIGGLFCQSSQTAALNHHLTNLHPQVSDYFQQTAAYTSKWGSLPTTRQGDDCERRIAFLEEQIRDLTFDPTFEPVFTPYEEDKYGNKEEMSLSELTCDEV